MRTLPGLYCKSSWQKRRRRLGDTEASSSFTSTPDYCVAPRCFSGIRPNYGNATVCSTEMRAMTDGCNHKKRGRGQRIHIQTHLNVWVGVRASVRYTKNLPVFLPHAAGCLQKDAFKLRTNEFEVSSLVFWFFFIQRDKYANFTHEVLIRTFFVYPIHM